MIEEIDLIKKFENISANFPDRLLKLEGYLSRDNSKLRELKLDGVDAIDFDLNHNDYGKINEFLKKAEKIDILINNAGYLVNKSFKETTLEDFKMVYSTNVF